jgi:hypothetical protein
MTESSEALPGGEPAQGPQTLIDLIVSITGDVKLNPTGVPLIDALWNEFWFLYYDTPSFSPHQPLPRPMLPPAPPPGYQPPTGDVAGDLQLFG